MRYILALMLCALTACAAGHPRLFGAQRAATVLVHSPCSTRAGSGVLIGSDRVLTAKHVIECVPSTVLDALPVTVTMPNGTDVQATIEITTDTDLARLRLTATRHADRPLVRTAAPGSRACLAHAVPSRGRSCGRITAAGETIGAVEFTAKVVPGNSGSGLYDEDGALIGVVIWRRMDGQIGGMATAVPRWIVP